MSANDSSRRKESDVGAIKRVGKYILGPKFGQTPVKCIEQYIARKDNTSEFNVLKILTLKPVGEKDITNEIQGKALLHTEHSILSLLENEPGVIHQHGLVRYTVQEKVTNDFGEVKLQDVRRIALVLDCFKDHRFSERYSNITDLQAYVIQEKNLSETAAIRIFCKVLEIVERCHEQNIVHRDLKLGNIILNIETQEVRLNNFSLGKSLPSENDLLTDKRGTPTYLCPELISGRPYLGKPSDMWALGVTLFCLLFNQYPFYDKTLEKLCQKIKTGIFEIPANNNVSPKTLDVIKGLLVLDPKIRLTVSQALKNVRDIIADERALMTDTDLQVVPTSTLSTFEAPAIPRKCSLNEIHAINIDYANALAKMLGWDAKYLDCIDNTSESSPKKIKIMACPTKLHNLIGKDDEQKMLMAHTIYVATKIAEASKLNKDSVKSIKDELATYPTSMAFSSAACTATSENVKPPARCIIINAASLWNNRTSNGATTAATNSNGDCGVVP